MNLSAAAENPGHPAAPAAGGPSRKAGRESAAAVAVPAALPGTRTGPRGWHLRPFAGRHRYHLLARFLPQLWTEVARWATTAAPIPDHHADTTGTDYSRENLGRVLLATNEWEGFLLAKHLALYGWAADAELVGLLQHWSCEVHTRLRYEANSKK